MINLARPAVGSPVEPSSQASGSNAPDVSTSGSTVALVQARNSHPCRGSGRDTGRCMVRIPPDRDLCQYCKRTLALEAAERTGGPIQCPVCRGTINEDGHFDSLGHRVMMAPEDRTLIANIQRDRPR